MSSSNGCGRSLKYKQGYSHAYENIRYAHQGVARYLTFYTQIRPDVRDGRTSPRLLRRTPPRPLVNGKILSNLAGVPLSLFH